jgi:hypothetical protein
LCRYNLDVMLVDAPTGGGVKVGTLYKLNPVDA